MEKNESKMVKNCQKKWEKNGIEIKPTFVHVAIAEIGLDDRLRTARHSSKRHFMKYRKQKKTTTKKYNKNKIKEKNHHRAPLLGFTSFTEFYWIILGFTGLY